MTNATITTIATPPTSSAGGDSTSATATAVGIRAMLLDLNAGQVIAADKRVSESDGALYIPIGSIPSGVSLIEGGSVTIALDGLAAKTFEIMKVTTEVKSGGLSHLECFVKAT